MRTRKTFALAAVATAVLTACGGSDYNNDAVTTPAMPSAITAVPDSAVASSTALVAFLKGLKGDDDSTEPLTLPSAEVSASDTEEPQSL